MAENPVKKFSEANDNTVRDFKKYDGKSWTLMDQTLFEGRIEHRSIVKNNQINESLVQRQFCSYGLSFFIEFYKFHKNHN